MSVQSENRNMITSLVVEQRQQHHVGPEILSISSGVCQSHKKKKKEPLQHSMARDLLCVLTLSSGVTKFVRWCG